jgi:hypothetical protein
MQTVKSNRTFRDRRIETLAAQRFLPGFLSVVAGIVSLVALDGPLGAQGEADRRAALAQGAGPHDIKKTRRRARRDGRVFA